MDMQAGSHKSKFNSETYDVCQLPESPRSVNLINHYEER